MVVGSPKTLALLESDDPFACAVSYYKKPTVDLSQPAKVVFSDMPAIDTGLKNNLQCPCWTSRSQTMARETSATVAER